MADIESREYWDRRTARFAAEDAGIAELAKSPVQQLNALRRKLDALYADKDAHTAEEIAAVEAQIRAMETGEEWSRELTIERRAAWNALVKSGKLSKAGKVDMAAVRKAEQEQGWTLESLKRAVALHKL